MRRLALPLSSSALQICSPLRNFLPRRLPPSLKSTFECMLRCRPPLHLNFMFQAKLADFITTQVERVCARRRHVDAGAAETPRRLWQLIPEVFNELFLLKRLC